MRRLFQSLFSLRVSVQSLKSNRYENETLPDFTTVFIESLSLNLSYYFTPIQ